MRVQTEEWRRFIPGVRMYKGKLTYFYNGEKLSERGDFLIYDKEERKKWKVIIILPGVEVIPENIFDDCKNVETVIMTDSVKRFERMAFMDCRSLIFVRLSKNLEFIGKAAFYGCESLTSIFIPESCREICGCAFWGCRKLIILSVPRHTSLGQCEIHLTAFFEASHFQTNQYGWYDSPLNDEVNEWIKNLNQAQEFALHRECASIEPPSEDNILEIIKKQGLPYIHVKNEIGVTPLEYLEKNPYTDITEQKLIKRLVLDLMGEIIT